MRSRRAPTGSAPPLNCGVRRTFQCEVLLGEFVTIKRWRLRDSRQEAELVRLVQQQIKPHYRALSSDVRLGLLRIDGTRSYFAVQYWPSRAHWDAATRSASYAGWWAQYEPMLERGIRWWSSRRSLSPRSSCRDANLNAVRSGGIAVA